MEPSILELLQEMLEEMKRQTEILRRIKQNTDA